MARCLLALGSNLGDRNTIMTQACAQIAQLPECHLLLRSSWHGTMPIGGAVDQGEFLNGVVLLETDLAPDTLAIQLRRIENRLGRQRVVRWDARTIDIDVLLYDRQVIETETLSVPHPRMSFRRFVLEPAAEIVGWMVHPTSGWTIARLLSHLLDSPRFIVVTSADAEIADCLVSHLAQHLNCPVWSGAEEMVAAACGLLGAGSVEFPERRCSGPPIIANLSPQTLECFSLGLLTRNDFERPALVIAADAIGTHALPACLSSLGSVARITTNEPATIIQEAEAAVCCVWPELS